VTHRTSLPRPTSISTLMHTLTPTSLRGLMTITKRCRGRLRAFRGSRRITQDLPQEQFPRAMLELPTPQLNQPPPGRLLSSTPPNPHRGAASARLAPALPHPRSWTISDTTDKDSSETKPRSNAYTTHITYIDYDRIPP